jgi:hypothetical protein
VDKGKYIVKAKTIEGQEEKTQNIHIGPAVATYSNGCE